MNKRMTSLSKGVETTFSIAAVVFWIGLLYYAFTQSTARAKVGVAFLGAVFFLFFLSELSDALEENNVVDVVLLAISGVAVVGVCIYMFDNFTVLYTVRVGYALSHELTMAKIFVPAAIYFVYRAYGWNFVMIILAGLVYGLYGNYIPGILGHGGIPLGRMVQLLVLDIEGFFGFLTRLTAAWIALFILFAGLLEGYGAFDLMIRFSLTVSKHIKSGVAQSAVVASMIMGMINGSTAANSAMTGAVTIPLMKKNGMKSETAAGIESVASTAGQVLPPIMGATAFVIAAILSVSYLEVIAAGFVPGLILVGTIAISVHFISVPQISQSDVSTESVEPKSKRTLMIESAQFLFPFALLVYFLGIAQWTVLSAALYSSIALMISGSLVRIAKPSSKSLSGIAENAKIAAIDLKDGLVVAAETLIPIAIILAAINGVVDILLVTGVPGSLSLAIMGVSGGFLLSASILAMVICIVLGMGMPTVAAYLIVATLIAPTLINQLGVPEMAAHFFVFYSAILAAITPPIATSVAVTTGIANSDFWKTGFEAMKISASLFILPYSFIFRPEVITGTPVQKITIGLFIFIGACGVVYAINYDNMWSDIDGKYMSGIRVLLFAVGIVTMIYPSQLLSLGGSIAIVILYLIITPTPIGKARKYISAN
ncbi:TRAP transporter permease [Natrinema halophilum]|uniref:TRAP transporter permease n=1 Tax=Natrinema halophilum TaxID=1699371 RepID=UPI001F4550AD|nr:TRAP transporter fused permease subunit [Natrinema halophilum]UHQ96368.1 TRAP transporter fused permease subunit [Natrinema halophilum]